MADEDLEELARLCVSARQFLIASGLVLLLISLVIGVVLLFGLPPKAGAVAAIVAAIAALAIAFRIRTPPHKFPTIRVLRDRPGDVAHIVSIQRGKDLLALVGTDRRLLAKPLWLKGSMSLMTKHSAGDVLEEQASQVTRAVAIVSRRCPHAATAKIIDSTGLTSMRKLVDKAIRNDA